MPAHPATGDQPSCAPADNLTMRAMGEADVAACHHLSSQLKWPHRLEDWQFMQRMGQGIVIEMRDAGGKPALIGSALSFNYGSSHATLGMVIVQPGLQGHGLGRRLMRRLLDETAGRIRLLNATPAGQPLYEKLGFVAVGALHQHQGTPSRPVPVDLPAGERLRPLESGDWPRIKALDANATGIDRSHVLDALAELAEGVLIEHDGDVIGFALVRHFGRGRVIGPVVAPDAGRAKALIGSRIAAHADSFIRIDVTAASQLSPWLADLGLPQVDTVVAMRLDDHKQAHARPGEVTLYSVMNQALG